VNNCPVEGNIWIGRERGRGTDAKDQIENGKWKIKDLERHRFTVIASLISLRDLDSFSPTPISAMELKKAR
jgi:hypothetical protein